MASICILLTLTVAIIGTRSAEMGGFPYLQCNKETLGHYGGLSLLECVVKTPYGDTEIRGITWQKASQTLLSVKDGDTKQQEPGYLPGKLSSWIGRNMTVSLVINNTEVKHNGSYEVTVQTDRGRCRNSTTLQVTAKYIKPTIRPDPKASNSRKGDNLTCVSDGGYPKGKLRWFDGDEELTDASQTEAIQTENGLFRLSSMLSLGERCSVSHYTCRVFNFRGGKEQATPFPMPDHFQCKAKTEELGQRKATNIAAPLVVIGSMIVGLLIVMVVYRRRSQRDHVKVPIEDNGGDLECEDSIP
ncbi:T-lymphocyte activation antigen CD80 isoform 2-T3 [Spinachia spinachia]